MSSKRLVVVKSRTGEAKPGDLGAGFQLLDDAIVFEGQKLAGADVASFEVLLKLPKEKIYLGVWARDRDGVWYGAKRVAGADPKTFVVIDEGSNLFAFDQQGRYEAGAPLNPVSDEQFERMRAAWEKKKKR